MSSMAQQQHSGMAQQQHSGIGELLSILVSSLRQFVIVLADTRGIFISWNPGVEVYFGYTAEEFIGQSYELLLPAGEKAAGVASRELATAAQNGRASDTRWLAKKNGDLILVEGVTLALRDDHGQLVGFGKVLRDVTTHRKREDTLDALARALDHSNVVVRKFDGAIEHWTKGCERLFGWSAQEAVGRCAHDLLHTVFPIPIEKIQKTLVAERTWTGELKMKRKDGMPVFVSSTWALLSDEGEQTAIIETHTDITARLQAQNNLEAANARLRNMARELERSNEELEEFARIASHDLSAPITSTRWLVDALRMRCSDRLGTDGTELVEQISQNLQRMGDLVEAVLKHARVGTSAIATNEPVNAEEALNVAMDNLRRDVELTGAQITHAPLPRLYIDFQALTQLFQNLLSNTMKYRRPEVPLAVRITATWEDPVWLIGVHDNGMGIEPDWFERVFQPFQRRHGRNIAGSGIGLATCKKIVTRAGGDIWVESALGSGSTFYFTLPGEPPASASTAPN
jgi:PAS domain S-box-containing protein